MRTLATILLMALAINAVYSTCLFTLYCNGCNTSDQCTSCNGMGDFDLGGGATLAVTYLSANSCSVGVATDAMKVPNGADYTMYYEDVQGDNGTYDTPGQFACQTSYYAYFDAADTSNSGCYSAWDSGTINGCDSNTVITNGMYNGCAKTSGGDYFPYAHMCTGGYKWEQTNATTAPTCSTATGISNCDSSYDNGGTENCMVCESGYVASYDRTSCVSKSSSDFDVCNQLQDGNTDECAQCNWGAIYNISGVCQSGNAKLVGLSLALIALVSTMF